MVFDTETSGLPKERNPSIYDTDKWPHIMQLSYIIYDIETGELDETYDVYINLNQILNFLRPVFIKFILFKSKKILC